MSSIQNYELKNLIGKGSYGAVYKAKRKADGLDVVVKQVLGHGRSNARAEARVLADLAHPTIVKYYDTFEDESEKVLYLVEEYCDGGDLSGLIHSSSKRMGSNRRRPGLPESTVLDYLAQMALALHYLHSQNLMHRDLKSPNVFLQDGCRRIKLGDFGVSTFLETSMDFAETCIGTPFYMSPELFNNNPYNFKSDIWALGCITYEILTGNHAFHSESLSALSDRVVKGKYSTPRIGSPNLLQLLKRMLSVNPNKRPTATHILKSPLLRRPLRCFLDRYLSLACLTQQRDEINSLLRQISVLALHELINLNRIGMGPGQETWLSQLEVTPNETAEEPPNDFVFVETLDPIPSDCDELIPSENPFSQTTSSINTVIDCSWSSVPPYDPVRACPGDVMPGNLSRRKSLLQRRCKQILGDDKFERCFAVIGTGRSTPSTSSDVTRMLGDELGPGWAQACPLVEQILWIDAQHQPS